MRKILTVLLCISMTVQAQQFHQEFGNPRKPYVESVAVPNHPDSYYRRGQQAQLCVTAREGGWPKNIDMTAVLTPAGCDSMRQQKSRRDDSTIDNDATTTQMHYLARLYRHTQEQRYRHAFHKAMQFILSGQYANGGWPQFWPENRGYQAHITYNDDAHKITGCRLERYDADGRTDLRLVADPDAKPLWARYYDLEEGRPFFCDRDGVPRGSLEEIGYERRNGYAWYNDRPATLNPSQPLRRR